MNNTFKPRNKFFLFPLAAIALVMLGGLVVMLLWNAILPSLIAGVGILTYPKAIGLLVLCKILFGGFRGRPGGYGGRGYKDRAYWREKTMAMTEEEREKFRAEWQQRCGR